MLTLPEASCSAWHYFFASDPVNCKPPTDKKHDPSRNFTKFIKHFINFFFFKDGNLNYARLCKGMESVDHTTDQINWPVPDCFDKDDLSAGGRRFGPGRERQVFTSNTCYRFSGWLSGCFFQALWFVPSFLPLPYHHLVKVHSPVLSNIAKVSPQLSVTRKYRWTYVTFLGSRIIFLFNGA